MSAMWKTGNRFEPLPEGKRFWPAMHESIAQSQHFLWIELYLMESAELAERFIADLVDAVARGASVESFLDGVGSMRLSREYRQRLSAFCCRGHRLGARVIS